MTIENVTVDPAAKDARHRTVSVTTLAREWGVHPNTVYRDIHKGALHAYRLPSGVIRIRRSDAERYGRPIV